MPSAPFTLHRPNLPNAPVILASPHSGRCYELRFLRASILNEVQIRSSEDAYVDLLIENAPSEGIPLLLAEAPRAFVDLNRASEELDPALIRGLPRGTLNPRVSSGLGVIPRVVANGRAIYRGKISRDEAERRLSEIWHPYHNALRSLMEETHVQFGQAILIDMHSMPHEAIESVTQSGQRPPQIVLGDRFGAACAAGIMDQVQAIFEAEGLRVARNAPFAGAYVTQTYGRPTHGKHALQIEIDRSLYLDEANVRPNAEYAGFRELMHRVVTQLARLGDTVVSLAAE